MYSVVTALGLIALLAIAIGQQTALSQGIRQTIRLILQDQVSSGSLQKPRKP
jgi:hypothetical protein